MLKSFLICYYGFMVAKLKKIFETIKQKYTKTLATLKNILYLCTRNAQMAESVDALVSNTSGAIRPGSTPGLGTILKYETLVSETLASVFCLYARHEHYLTGASPE